MRHFLTYYSLLLKVILLVFCLLSIEDGRAIDAPVLTCATVNSDGSITFEWDAVSDPAVEGYYLYQSDDSFVADIPGGTTTSYTHFGLDATVAQFCFYMYSYTNGGVEFSEQSEVTCTIFIDVASSTSPFGYAQINISGAYLAWDNPPVENYNLYLSKDGGPMELVPPNQVIYINYDVLHYEVIDCEADYQFYIELAGTNCVSNVDGQVFYDELLPPSPFITSLSIDSTDLNVDIEWSMPSINDVPSMANVGGYIIYQCADENNIVAIDTIFYRDSTHYSFETSITPFSQFSFSIAAFDNCLDNFGDYSNLGAGGDCSTTILLEGPIIDCDFVILKWLPYLGWGNNNGWDDAGGVGSYEILIHNTNQPDESLEIQNISEISFDGTHYIDTIYGLDFGSNVDLYIKAHSNLYDYEAISYWQTAPLVAFAGPEKTYLGEASVIAPDQIEISVITDSTALTHYYVIQKKQELDDVYQDVTSLESATQNFLSYIDDDVRTSKFSYQYRVVILNTCGDTVGITNSARTMLATTTNNDVNIFNSLIWSAYNEFDLPISNYTVYRSNALGVLGDEIGTTANSSTSFIDNLGEDALMTNGFFCYTVKATESLGNIYDYQGESFSNQICTQFDPLIYIPNAFMVGGVNTVFKPVISLADFENYSMEIYSRSGNLIFRSLDYDLGWNGFNNGSEMADGAYIYVIRVKDGQGKLHENNGMVFKFSY